MGLLEIGQHQVRERAAPWTYLLPKALSAFRGAENLFKLLRASIERPFGNQNEQPGAAVGVMEAVHSHVLALGNRFIDQSQQLSCAP